MYNGNKVNELLRERKLKAVDLLNHLGVKDNGTVARFTGPDIKASRLEQIADFFGVSIDTFFLREAPVGAESTGAYSATVGTASSRAREFEARCKSLEREMAMKDALLAERDRTIALMNDMIDLLKGQLGSDKSGTK